MFRLFLNFSLASKTYAVIFLRITCQKYTYKSKYAHIFKAWETYCQISHKQLSDPSLITDLLELLFPGPQPIFSNTACQISFTDSFFLSGPLKCFCFPRIWLHSSHCPYSYWNILSRHVVSTLASCSNFITIFFSLTKHFLSTLQGSTLDLVSKSMPFALKF